MVQGLKRTSNILQTIVWPTAASADRFSLFAMPPTASVVASQNGEIVLCKGQTIDLCTFFNGFSHWKWHVLTAINSVIFRLDGSGRIRLRILAWTPTAAAWVVHDLEHDLDIDGVTVEILKISEILGRVLSVEITCLSVEAILHSGEWATCEPPKRDVRLLAVITTFKREDAVNAAIARFSSKTIPGVPFGSLELLVVDNGSTLGKVSAPGVRVVSNRNLGGAGGFARGLMQALDDGRWTHCLFMDDDAACEPESVWRTMAIMAYATDTRLSVSGAMLHTDRPTMQYEKGARFAREKSEMRIWQALGNMRDLSDRAAVVSNDCEDQANYGAWWFFCFSLDAIRHWPFPFFVRGDDVDFSLANELPIATLNGIATWAENFGYKLTPPTEYLAWRSWAALALMHSDRKVAQRAIKTALRAAVTLGLRYDYGGMLASIAGIEDCLDGPEFFASKPAPLDRLAMVRLYDRSKEPSERDVRDSVAVPHYRVGVLRRIISAFTFGGHFLPRRLQRASARHTRIGWEAGTTGMLRSPAAIYGQGTNLTLHKVDRTAMLAGLNAAVKAYLRQIWLLDSVQEMYREKGPAYRTRQFWEQALFHTSDDR